MKYLVLAFVCSIKNKLELKHDFMAESQIRLLLAILKDLEEQQTTSIKRFFTVDLLNFERFLIYREEKSDIIAMINSVFKDDQIVNHEKEERITPSNKIVDFFNARMHTFH